MFSDDELRQMTRAARLYYDAGENQAAVARHLGVSRATVSRLLARARLEGIVEIRINDPLVADASLAAVVREVTGLSDVVVTNGRATSPDLVRRRIGLAAARYLRERLTSDDVVGIGWGRTLYETAQALEERPRSPRLVPLLGGLGQVAPSFQVHEIARVFAERLSATWSPLYVPAIVPHPQTHRALMGSPDAQRVTEAWSQLTCAVVGIGEVAHGNEVEMLFSAYLTDDVLGRLTAAGAVGDICMRFFDAAGREIPDALGGVIAISWAHLAAVPRVIAVAGGAEKAAAIQGAARSGLIDVLITDEVGARALVGWAAGHAR
jgi:deoxyribonucleoside regulator